MVRLRRHRHGNKQIATKVNSADLIRFSLLERIPISERRAIEKCSHLLRQLLIQRYGFDMRKHPLAGF